MHILFQNVKFLLRKYQVINQLHVHVNVFVPTQLSGDEKKTLKELGELDHINPDRSLSKEGSDQRTSSAFFDKMKGAFSG